MIQKRCIFWLILINFALSNPAMGQLDTCPDPLAQSIQNADYQQQDSQDLIYKAIQEWVYDHIGSDCISDIALTLSDKIDLHSHDLVVQAYLALGLYLPPDEPGLRDAYAHTYDRLGPPTGAAWTYFRTLSHFRIDQRARLDPLFLDRAIGGHRDTVFYFYRYLLMLDDPRAVPAFERAIDAVAHDAHAILGILTGLQHTQKPVLVPLYQRFVGDCRRGIGVFGPETGPTLHSIATIELPYLSQDTPPSIDELLEQFKDTVCPELDRSLFEGMIEG